MTIRKPAKSAADKKRPRAGAGAGGRNTAARGKARSRTAGGPSGSVPGERAPRELYSLSESETLGFGQALGRTLNGGELVLLHGELGSGKTVFTRGIASSLGIDPQDVGS